jgi:hypothetical protein
LYGWLDRKLGTDEPIETHPLLGSLYHEAAMQKRWNAYFKGTAIRPLRYGCRYFVSLFGEFQDYCLNEIPNAL